MIGSTGLASTNAFFESQTDLTTDDARKTFAKEGLKDLKFLYSNTTAEDPKACDFLSFVSIILDLSSQLFRGLFCGPLVLRTFAAHLSAISGAVEVDGWKEKPARSGLILSAAAVSS